MITEQAPAIAIKLAMQTLRTLFEYVSIAIPVSVNVAIKNTNSSSAISIIGICV
jgi:hypothetical protein